MLPLLSLPQSFPESQGQGVGGGADVPTPVECGELGTRTSYCILLAFSPQQLD